MSRTAAAHPGTSSEPSSTPPAEPGHCCGCSRQALHSSLTLTPPDISTDTADLHNTHLSALELHFQRTGTKMRLELVRSYNVGIKKAKMPQR